jgi:hypothetical protein
MSEVNDPYANLIAAHEYWKRRMEERFGPHWLDVVIAFNACHDPSGDCPCTEPATCALCGDQ